LISVRPHFSRSRSFRPRRGFALLLTLTLLAFVVLLLVALATYTRVETAVAGNMQRQAQARENALLALNVALDQLQQHAGPDQRVTATAESRSGVNLQKRYYTGVWNGDAAETSPRVWLASGAEAGEIDLEAAIPAARAVTLVGPRTDGSTAANATVAELQDIRVPGVPGVTTAQPALIGRYAWWVGDQGVKAPVAVGDSTESVTYAPYDSGELRSRIRQQIALGAGAVGPGGNAIFETRDANNRSLVANGKVSAYNQISLLRNGANAAVGLVPLQSRFHVWSANNFGVLANAKRGGLRQDLSLMPELLGPEFAAWANYESYMEVPSPGAATAADPTPPAPFPNYSDADALRRRYRISTGTDEARVVPVLSFFYLTFGVRKPTAIAPYTVSLRWAAALWNPYSSALVPEDLRLEISGLPNQVDILNVDAGSTAATFSLRERYGEPLTVALPWTRPSGDPVSDKQSWLPGRVYNWVSEAGLALVSGGNAGRFDSADLPGFENGVLDILSGNPSVNGSTRLALSLPDPTTLTIRLVRARDDATIATYTSPTYLPVTTTTPSQASNNTSPLGFLFRLAEGIDSITTGSEWLTTYGLDPRNVNIEADALRAVPGGPDPTAYRFPIRVYEPDRLLNRDKTTGTSYDEDVPVFELPRSPVLSLGMLQHYPIESQRPFAIGNPWGTTVELNGIRAGELFDRFYFSGLTTSMTPSVTAAGDLLMPNPLLQPLRKPDGAKPDAADLRATTGSGARSSRYFLQGGAFNINATNPAAWASILRGIRFPAPQSFTYLDVLEATGTAEDVATASVQSGDAHFFRFSHSAQETYKANPGLAETGSATASPANTHLFRRGVRTLSPEQVSALGARIGELVTLKLGTDGPFRSLEEFVSPQSLFSGVDSSGVLGAPRSVLEAAIANSDVNASVAEFSSQWLTQADIMTALAPVLFARSDTFLIRTYGESVNPATGATEGRAWCEATVQRVPEYFDASADDAVVLPDELTSALNLRYGRRFKVISFRWLTRSDI